MIKIKTRNSNNNNKSKNNNNYKLETTTTTTTCRLCGDRDGTINHMKSEYIKLALTEYKTRHDLVGKVIH